MYVSMNCLNIFLVDREGAGGGSGFGEPGASPGEPEVTVPDALAGPFPFLVASLGAESSSSSLETAEPL